ncbi:MAG: histidine kinase [Hoeflea sp.]|nr:histidine kinase [Hoeflea sp.]
MKVFEKTAEYFAGDGSHSGWIERIQNISPSLMISLARVFVAIFAIIAIYADPEQSVLNRMLTYTLLTAYALNSFVVWYASTRSQTAGLAIVTHVVDVSVFIVLVFLTEGPTSPLFVLFTFALFSAALTWSWRAVAYTAATITLAYAFFIGSSDFESGDEITKTIIRGAYLMAASILFVYFAAALERERMRYLRLAAWPTGSATNTQFPDLHPLLSHVASIANIQRLLVVWEDPYEPNCFFAEMKDAATRYWTESGLELDGTLPSNRPIIVSRQHTAPSLPELTWVLERHEIEVALVAPLGTLRRGWLFFVRKAPSGDELLPLASVAALRLGAEIDHHYLRRDLLDAAVREGRSKLARDIHDSLLQSLTAVSLQMKSVERELPGLQRDRLAAIRRSIQQQQHKLRQLVAGAPTLASSERIAVAGAIGACLERLQAEWMCTASLTVSPTNLGIAAETLDGLLLFITESVANAVRHGKATHIDVHASASERRFTLLIRDNGSGLAGHNGYFPWGSVSRDEIGSASLRQRAADIGAIMNLASASDGLVVCLEAPLE